MNKQIKVFLGGTCNGSVWRNELIPLLNIEYFDTVVEDWTSSCIDEEIKQREECTYCLYVITPEMEGCYSIAEVVDDSNKRPDKTIYCLLDKYGGKEFTINQLKSLKQVGRLIIDNKARYYTSLKEVIKFLNGSE